MTTYRTRANKGRGLYSKNIFWAIIAAINQERLLFENNFSQQFSLYTQMGDPPHPKRKKKLGRSLYLQFDSFLCQFNDFISKNTNTATIPIFYPQNQTLY